ncbi:unnamed protein product, partial [Urochloa humidicola]
PFHSGRRGAIAAASSNCTVSGGVACRRWPLCFTGSPRASMLLPSGAAARAQISHCHFPTQISPRDGLLGRGSTPHSGRVWRLRDGERQMRAPVATRERPGDARGQRRRGGQRIERDRFGRLESRLGYRRLDAAQPVPRS